MRSTAPLEPIFKARLIVKEAGGNISTDIIHTSRASESFSLDETGDSDGTVLGAASVFAAEFMRALKIRPGDLVSYASYYTEVTI